MLSEENALRDEALEAVHGVVNMEELKAMSPQEREKLAQQKEQEVQALLTQHGLTEPPQLEEAQKLQENNEAKNKTNKTLELLTQNADLKLKINMEIVRNI